MEIENIFHTPLCLPLEYSLSAFQARMGVAALAASVSNADGLGCSSGSIIAKELKEQVRSAVTDRAAACVEILLAKVKSGPNAIRSDRAQMPNRSRFTFEDRIPLTSGLGKPARIRHCTC